MLILIKESIHCDLNIVKLLLRPMKSVGYIGIVSIIFLLGIISCGEDEIQEEGIEPFFNITFIDNDSLAFLNGNISSIDGIIASIDERITEIDAAENKGELLDEKDSLNEVKDSLSTERSVFNDLIRDVNSGLTELSSINTIPVEFPTKTEHTFALNSNDTISRYFIVLKKTVQDTLFITYDLNLEFRENTMRAIATELDTPFHTFDSINFSCTSCSSNEKVLTVYF